MSSTSFLTAAKWNAMLQAARCIVESVDQKADIDPFAVQWARELLAANPAPKRTSPRTLDQVAALFSTPEIRAAGLTAAQMVAIAPELNAGRSERIRNGSLHKLLHRLCSDGRMHLLKGRRVAARYFLTAEERDSARERDETDRSAEGQAKREAAAARRASRAEAKARAKAEKPPRIPRLAKTKPPRKPRDAMTDARRSFNGPIATKKTKAEKALAGPTRAQQLPDGMFRTKNSRVNPDQGGPWAPKPKADREAVIPPGLEVQRAPSYTHDPRFQCAPDERPFGAGFSALPIGYSPITGKPWA